MSRKEKRKNCKEYWITQGYSMDEAIEKAKEYARKNCSSCIEYWRDRHPDWTEQQCQIALSEKLSIINTHRPDLTGKNNPSHSSKTTVIERRKRSPMCIEFYINKHPNKTYEECVKLLDKHKAYCKSKMVPEVICTCPEYWTSRGYSRDEAINIIHDGRFAFSLKKCIMKYGEECGRKFYEDRQIRWQQSLRKNFIKFGYNGIHQSQFANSIIDILNQYFDDLDKEFNIAKYSFDLKRNQKLIEFNGDYWHMNPSKYQANDVNKTSKKIAQDIWDNDLAKINEARSCGYQVLVIWESEYRKDPIGIIQKCKEFLL